MGDICALLLSGSDIRFLGTTGPEPKPEPDIRYIHPCMTVKFSDISRFFWIILPRYLGCQKGSEKTTTRYLRIAETERFAGDAGSDIVKGVITHRAPQSVMIHLQPALSQSSWRRAGVWTGQPQHCDHIPTLTIHLATDQVKRYNTLILLLVIYTSLFHQ